MYQYQSHKTDSNSTHSAVKTRSWSKRIETVWPDMAYGVSTNRQPNDDVVQRLAHPHRLYKNLDPSRYSTEKKTVLERKGNEQRTKNIENDITENRRYRRRSRHNFRVEVATHRPRSRRNRQRSFLCTSRFSNLGRNYLLYTFDTEKTEKASKG